MEEIHQLNLDLVVRSRSIFHPARLSKTARNFGILERNVRWISDLVEDASDASCVRWLQDPAEVVQEGRKRYRSRQKEPRSGRYLPSCTFTIDDGRSTSRSRSKLKYFATRSFNVMHHFILAKNKDSNVQHSTIVILFCSFLCRSRSTEYRL